jgi:hypothetical protein
MIIKCNLRCSFNTKITLFFRLCLANSERIKYTPYMHMVFEVQDLASASPATVSRYVFRLNLRVFFEQFLMFIF